MSHFYGSIRGSAKTEVTRAGSKSSGMHSHIRSWNRGIAVSMLHNEEGNVDRFAIYLTGGSTRPHPERILASFAFDASTGKLLSHYTPEVVRDIDEEIS